MQNVAVALIAPVVLCDHEKFIQRFAKRFIGGGASLDDLMQEGRIALWNASKRWEKRAKLTTFAYREVFGAMLRCASAHIADSHEELDDQMGQTPQVDMALLIQECLSILNPREKEVVERWMSGETFEEIGRSFDRTDGWARFTVKQAANKIRERVET